MTQRNDIELQKVQKESIRLMGENALSMTTETRLKGVRESMAFTRARNTIRRTGWYFTEPYAPCGKMET